VLARQGGTCRSTAEFGPEYDLGAKCNLLASAPADSKNPVFFSQKGCFVVLAVFLASKTGVFMWATGKSAAFLVDKIQTEEKRLVR